jgi:hypothetical protein
LVSSETSRKRVKEKTVTGMMIFNLIAAIVVVAGLATVCRTAHVVAGWRNEEPKPVEAGAQRELKRAA